MPVVFDRNRGKFKPIDKVCHRSAPVLGAAMRRSTRRNSMTDALELLKTRRSVKPPHRSTPLEVHRARLEAVVPIDPPPPDKAGALAWIECTVKEMVPGGDQTTNKSTTLEFKAKVPDGARPGTYPVKVTAKDSKGATVFVETINYRVTSKKIETGGIKLTSQYPVLSTGAGQTLKFTIDLKNETNKPLTTSLAAQAPAGWTVRFKPQFGDQQISSIQLKESGSETLSVEIDTPAKPDAKEQPVRITARSGPYEATTNVNISVKGSPDLKMGTAGGTLNTSVTAGTKTPIDFLVGNAGTAPIRNLAFVTKKPSDKWTVEFKPDKIDALNPGEVREIKMEIFAPDRTIAGDYLLTLTANAVEATKSSEFRVTVSTPTIWGWIGFGIVGLVVLGLAIVFFRLGRR
jgi:uncharacterized membrane protein